MNVRGVLLGGFTMLVWVASAFAQPTELPVATVTGKTFTAGQVSEIQQYAQHYVTQLVGDDQEKAADARRKLFGAFGRNPTDEFLVEYGRQIAQVVRGALEVEGMDKKPVARMNAMLVLARMPGDAPLDVMLPRLGDPADPVRYWAAKGVRNWVETSAATANPGKVDEIVGVLRQVVLTEPNADVLTQLIVALVNIGTTTAGDTAMYALEGRLKQHQQNSDMSLQPELEGILRQINRLTQLDVRKPGSVNESFRLLARVAFLYFEFGSIAMQDPANRDRVNELAQLLLRCDSALRASARAVKANTDGVPSDVQQIVNTRGRWNELTVRALQWRAVLLADPFKFADAQLK